MTYKIIYNFNCKDYMIQVPRTSFNKVRSIMLINKRKQIVREAMVIKRNRKYIVTRYYFEAYNGDTLLFAETERYVRFPWYVLVDKCDFEYHDECYPSKDTAMNFAERRFERLTAEDLKRRKQYAVVESWTRDPSSDLYAKGDVVKDFLKGTKNK